MQNYKKAANVDNSSDVRLSSKTAMLITNKYKHST